MNDLVTTKDVGMDKLLIVANLYKKVVLKRKKLSLDEIERVLRRTKLFKDNREVAEIAIKLNDLSAKGVVSMDDFVPIFNNVYPGAGDMAKLFVTNGEDMSYDDNDQIAENYRRFREEVVPDIVDGIELLTT